MYNVTGSRLPCALCIWIVPATYSCIAPAVSCWVVLVVYVLGSVLPCRAGPVSPWSFLSRSCYVLLDRSFHVLLGHSYLRLSGRFCQCLWHLLRSCHVSLEDSYNWIRGLFSVLHDEALSLLNVRMHVSLGSVDLRGPVIMSSCFTLFRVYSFPAFVDRTSKGNVQ